MKRKAKDWAQKAVERYWYTYEDDVRSPLAPLLRAAERRGAKRERAAAARYIERGWGNPAADEFWTARGGKP